MRQKNIYHMALAMFLLTLVLTASCSQEIQVPPKSNILDYTFVQKYVNTVDTEIWEETCTVDFTETGMKITGTKNWMGGALRNSASGQTFDFRQIDTLSFDIRGTVPAEYITVYVMGVGKIGDDQKLSERLTGYNDTTYTTCTIDLSAMTDIARTEVTHVFTFVVENPDGIANGYESGQWIEVSNIDFRNSADNHVDLSYADSSATGSLANIFAVNDNAALDLQVWSETCNLKVTNNGLKIISKGGSWFGGAVVPQTPQYVNLTNVKSISFAIRGDMTANQVKVGVATPGKTIESVLSTLDATKEINAETFTTYVLPLEGFNTLQQEYGLNLLQFCQGDKYAGIAHWIEIQQVQLFDASGNRVPVSCQAPAFTEGSWSDLFTEIPAEGNIDLQIWIEEETKSSTFISQLIQGEGLKVIPTGSWFGGGIVNPKDNLGYTDYEQFNFSDVATIEFKIKGTTPKENLTVYVTSSETAADGETKFTTSQLAISGLSPATAQWTEEDYQTVTIDVSTATNGHKIDTATFPVAFGGVGSGWQGTWFEIKDITFKNDKGEPIQLDYSL